jgi:hypothetical protein
MSYDRYKISPTLTFLLQKTVQISENNFYVFNNTSINKTIHFVKKFFSTIVPFS